jgi:3-oxoacyl-[acyl-carrier protein] reductase
VQQATATLAEELIPRGITVNCVNPGPTDTGYLAHVDPGEAIALGRWGEQDDARWITGQTLNSEGGFVRERPAASLGPAGARLVVMAM